MAKKRPLRRFQVSRYSDPPNHNPRLGRVPDHGMSTKHHMIPRSRGGETAERNLLDIPEKLHQAWHYLFTNMRPEEAMVFIATHMSPLGYFDQITLRRGDRKIVLDRKGLVRLAYQPVDRSSMPSFDGRYVVPVAAYGRKRRTRR